MSRTIWKCQIPITNRSHTVTLPGVGILPVHVAMQGEIPTMWVEVDPDAKKTWDIDYQWFGTGQDIPGNAMYVGTVQDGALVFHLYGVAFSNGATR